jgi:phosphopantetheine--protein transferase-like protein
MADAVAAPERCGIDTVEIARIERLLAETPEAELGRWFSEGEIYDAGHSRERAASLAARFAAKEACAKLFPRETAAGAVGPEDFSVATDNYGAPQVICGPRAQAALGRNRIARIELSLTHDRASASAIALAVPAKTDVPIAGRILYRWFPIRRSIILDNLTRVYGDRVGRDEIVRLAQAHYAHLWRLLGEFLKFRWLSPSRKAAIVRLENLDALTAAFERGKGVLVLTGHFGNWEVATVAGIGNYPHFRGRFQFVRRALKPDWLDAMVTRRFNAGGFGVLPKRGSLDAILGALEKGDFIVFPFDQHAQPPDGIEVDFFGHPAWTFKSLAILALATGAPVVPASAWREPDGRHVLRFEDPLPPVENPDAKEAIRATTRGYNEVLERLILLRPEQWYWVHRRWKTVKGRRASPKAGGA